MGRPISFPSNQPILNALEVFLQFIIAFLDDSAVMQMGCVVIMPNSRPFATD